MRTDKRGARPAGAAKRRNKTDGSAIRPYQWIAILIATFIASCAAPDTRHQIVVSTREQKLALLDRGNVMAIYPVSTSKFGLGDWRGSRFTPLGQLQVAVFRIADPSRAPPIVHRRRRINPRSIPIPPVESTLLIGSRRNCRRGRRRRRMSL